MSRASRAPSHQITKGVSMRTLLIGLTIVLTLLVVACGPFASSEPATVPTSAPAIAPATAPAATAAATPTTAPQTAPTARPQISPTAAPANTAAGDTVRIVLVQGSNEARYRVREQLAGVNFPSDAVGATKAVTGVIVAKPDGTILRDQSKITVDLSTLRSDDDRRDNFLRTSALQTSRYPTATFVPTEARGLSLPLKDG